MPDRNSSRLIADITKNVIVLVSLLTLIVNFLVQNARADDTTHSERIIACSRQFQDRVNESSLNTTIALNDLVVAVASTPTDTRQQRMDQTVAALTTTADLARRAVANKTAWNAAGNPLPCPI